MNNTTPSRIRGFSLPELLAVIAIIGILSTVVINGVTTARQRARESGAVAEIQALALEAELYYRTNSRSYLNICGAAAATQGIRTLRDRALNTGPCVGGSGVCYRCNVNAAGTAYAFDFRIRTGATEYYCVDSARAAKRRSGGALLAANVYACP